MPNQSAPITIMDILNYDTLTIERQIDTLFHYGYMNDTIKNKNDILALIVSKRLSIGVIEAANELCLKFCINTEFEDTIQILKFINEGVYDKNSLMKKLKGSISPHKLEQIIVNMICEIEDLEVFKQLILNNKESTIFVFKEKLSDEKKELFNKYINTNIFKFDDIIIEERRI